MRRLASEAYFKRLVLDKVSTHFYYHNNIDCGNQIGVPDTFIEGKESDLWVEFKIIKNTNGAIHIDKLTSIHQKNWFKRREAVRADALLVIGFIVDNKIRIYHTMNCSDEISRELMIKRSSTIDDFVVYLKDRLD